MGVLARKLTTAFLLLALAVPALAQPIRTSIKLVSPAKLAGTVLKPGDYDVVADDTKVTLSAHGKMVGEAKVEWKDGRAKTDQTSVLMAGDEIKEIRFGGKTQYAVIQP